MPVDEQIYLDTIALIKHYVPEQNSDRIDTYFAGQVQVAALAISRLTCVELRSTLAGISRENRQNSWRMPCCKPCTAIFRTESFLCIR
jgi:predicted nucleic acid-binding protein